MRKYENDYLLWAAISTPLFCAALAYENFGPGGGGRRNWTDGIGFWVIAAGVVGWALHGVAVVCGLRLTGRVVQSEDYDDDLVPPRRAEPRQRPDADTTSGR